MFKKIFLLELLTVFGLCLIIGFSIGCTCALFLFLLDYCTKLRELNLSMIYFLPFSGFFIGLMYYYFGQNISKGNNLLLEEFKNPSQIIPFKMAPLVLIGTILTHLFGGSAGREGTALQLGVAISSQISKIKKTTKNYKKLLIALGISAGFAGVFGTPYAATIFTVEILYFRKKEFKYIIPCLISSLISHYTCLYCSIEHTHYDKLIIPSFNFSNLYWVALVGILCGIVALFYSTMMQYWTRLFTSIKIFPPIKTMMGGLILTFIILILELQEFSGLGISTIQESFSRSLPHYYFIIKLLLTSFTLAIGFKGGEVTPLFFIGATFGNALIWFVPLPISLLAGIGFLAVFAGATHSPIASSIMGIEIFGWNGIEYIFIACLMAYFFSGNKGIYSSQKISYPKIYLYKKLKLIE